MEGADRCGAQSLRGDRNLEACELIGECGLRSWLGKPDGGVCAKGGSGQGECVPGLLPLGEVGHLVGDTTCFTTASILLVFGVLGLLHVSGPGAVLRGVGLFLRGGLGCHKYCTSHHMREVLTIGVVCVTVGLFRISVRV